MIEMILFQLFRATVFLAVGFPVVWLLIRCGRLRSALGQRIAWGSLLVVSLPCMTVPARIPVSVDSVETVAETVDPIPDLPLNAVQPEWNFVPEPVAVADVPVANHTVMVAEQGADRDFAATVSANAKAFGRADLMMIVAGIWLAGLTTLFGRRVFAHLSLLKLLRQSPSVDETQWPTLLREHGISARKIPLRLTESAGPALVRGPLHRLSLIVPKPLWDEISPVLRQGILRHELGHYRHGDTLLSPLLFFLAALQWFNPFAWLVLRRYDEATEWHADQFAYGSRETGSSELAETFLAIHRSTESIGLYLNSFSRFSTLDRVNRLLPGGGKEHFMKKLVIGTVLILLFGCGLFRVQLVAEQKQRLEQNDPDAAKEIFRLGEERVIEVRGRVLMPDGSPAPECWLNTQQVSGWSNTTATNSSDKKGEFTDKLHVGAHYMAMVRRPVRLGGPVDDLSSSVVATIVTDPPTPGQFDIQLKEGVRVRGSVLYENGEPASGKSVGFRVYPFGKEAITTYREAGFSSGSGVSLAFDAVSDEQGNFAKTLQPGEYVVSVSNLYGNDREKTIVLKPEDKEFRLDFTLPEPTRGKVLLPDGSPAADQEIGTVIVEAKDCTMCGNIKTDADGNFSVHLSPYASMLQIVTKDGRFGLVRYLDGEDRNKPLELVLQPPATGKVRLISSETGKPIAGHPLRYSSYLKSSMGNASYFPVQTQSDSEGRVVLDRLYVGGKYELDFQTPMNVHSYPALQCEFEPQKPDEVIDLGEKRIHGDYRKYETEISEKPVSHRFFVKDKDGKPIDGAKLIVQLLPERKEPWHVKTGDPIAEFRLTTEADGGGDFTVTKEQAQTPDLFLHAVAAHPDHISTGFWHSKYAEFVELQKTLKESERWTIELEPSVPASGTVLTPDGKPAIDVLVFAHSQDEHYINGAKTTTRTDKDGKFRIGMLPAENRWLWILPNDFAPLSLSLKKDESELGTLRLQEGVVLEGRFLDNGKPVENIWVSVLPKDTPAVKAQGHDGGGFRHSVIAVVQNTLS